MIFFSLGDFIALLFAPQSVVMPVGAWTLVANVYFAHVWLQEKLTRGDLVGTALIILGAAGIAVSYGAMMPPDAKITHGARTLVQLNTYFEHWAVWVYAVLVVALLVALYFCVIRPAERLLKLSARRGGGPDGAAYAKLRKWHPFAYPAVSGVMGAQSVLFANCTVSLIAASVRAAGTNQFGDGVGVVLFLCMCGCVFTQTHFLAKGLEYFDALYIIPVFQVLQMTRSSFLTSAFSFFY